MFGDVNNLFTSFGSSDGLLFPFDPPPLPPAGSPDDSVFGPRPTAAQSAIPVDFIAQQTFEQSAPPPLPSPSPKPDPWPVTLQTSTTTLVHRVGQRTLQQLAPPPSPPFLVHLPPPPSGGKHPRSPVDDCSTSSSDSDVSFFSSDAESDYSPTRKARKTSRSRVAPAKHSKPSRKRWTKEWNDLLLEADKEVTIRSPDRTKKIMNLMKQKSRNNPCLLKNTPPCLYPNQQNNKYLRQRLASLKESRARTEICSQFSEKQQKKMKEVMKQFVKQYASNHRDPATGYINWKTFQPVCFAHLKSQFPQLTSCPFSRQDMKNAFNFK